MGFARVPASSTLERHSAGKEFTMLVLSRKVGERVIIPDCGLTITVLAVQGQRVRLGISAPADTAMYREEVWHREQSLPQEEAAALGPNS